ncbi:MAG: phosphoglucosamine mutase [Thermoplasmatota archaeon]
MSPAPSFGSSGIRGRYGAEITVELACGLGRALGSLRHRVLVGRDGRTSGPALEAAAVAGLLSAGADVVRAGPAPTPSHAWRGRAFDAALVITASHNPAPDNGFKFWDPDGRAFDAKARAAIEQGLARTVAPDALPSWSKVGSVSDERGIPAMHAAAIASLVGPLARPLRVVVDAGNGVGGLVTPDLLRAMGANVVTLNAQLDGTFPARPSEPSPENLRDLTSAVRSFGADLGIAHDGDADRCVAVCEDGSYVSGDQLLALLAQASKARKIVVPVDTSLLVEDALPGVEVVKTRVGDAYISEAIAETGAGWGGEPSGAWIFPTWRGKTWTLCPDGPMAAAIVAAFVADRGSLRAQIDALPRYPIERAAVAVANESKKAVIARVAESLAALGKVSTIDGVRVDAADGWLLVRASGTEPKVRVTAEARSEAAAVRLREMGLAAVEAAKKSAGSALA